MEGSTVASVGETLRKAREEKKLTIEQVNVETKISPEVLRALEADDRGSFASETYLKGFVKNYANYLGLDGNHIWGMVMQKRDEASGAPGATWDIEETVKEEKLSSPRIFKRFVLPILIIAIVVLVGLLIRENRKVKSLTTGANTHYLDDEVITGGNRQV